MKRLTPMDIFNQDFKHVFRGYRMEEVNRFLDLVIQNYEDVLQENEHLKEQIKQLKKNPPVPSAGQGQYEDIIREMLQRIDHLEHTVHIIKKVE
jgi:DivIVA domain-containing protein